MASSKEYLSYILEQLSDLEEITFRQMMGNTSFINAMYDELPAGKKR